MPDLLVAGYRTSCTKKSYSDLVRGAAGPLNRCFDSTRAEFADYSSAFENFIDYGANWSNGVWSWPRLSTNYFPWCSSEPTNLEPRESAAIVSFNLNNVKYSNFQLYAGSSHSDCLYDTWNDGDFGAWLAWKGYSRYVCKKPYWPINSNPNAVYDINADRCLCQTKFVDIVDVNIPEGRHYTRGEICTPPTPCWKVTNEKKSSLSIVFVVDASDSIGKPNWKDVRTPNSLVNWE